MDTVTVNGMVLSAMPIGEYDRRIVLLTTDLGRISCICAWGKTAKQFAVSCGTSIFHGYIYTACRTRFVHSTDCFNKGVF